MTDINIDQLIRSKRKTVSLIITKEAKLQVRAPLRLPLNEINKIVNEKSEWIIKYKNIAIKKLEQAQILLDKTKGQILFLGKPYKITPNENIKTILLEDKKMLIPVKWHGNYEFLENWYKKQAAFILHKRIDEISRHIGISFQGFRITGARKRWGSCNSKNHINLSWRLVMAEYNAIDYVIIHELCHVVHKNHSSAFWDFLSGFMPDYKIWRKWLKDNSFILESF